jgi:hypothetical protein
MSFLDKVVLVVPTFIVLGLMFSAIIIIIERRK